MHLAARGFANAAEPFAEGDAATVRARRVLCGEVEEGVGEPLESKHKTCYLLVVMAKPLKAPSDKGIVKGSPLATKAARSAKAGRSVTVKGVGALKDYDLKIKKGVNLLKPIAEQVLGRHSEKRKAR